LSKDDLDQIKTNENYKENYIIIKKVTKKENEFCCIYQGTSDCVCNLIVYKIRPYTFELLRALQPFFEIIVFSQMYHKIVEYIIDHIEGILNKPV
jgi:hypothetical protein